MGGKKYSEVEKIFLEKVIPGNSYKKTAELFNETFDNKITWEQVKNFSKNNDILVNKTLSLDGKEKSVKMERCKFWQTNNACYVLDVAQCDGYNTACTFRKTPSEYEIELEKSILKNREKGNCEHCKYRLYKKCKLRGEK